jgi:hypothetical protein
VLTLMPGNTSPTSESFRLAGGYFMTFSRVRLSLHCLSTWTRVCPAAYSTIRMATRSSVTIGILPRLASFNP